MRKFNMLFVVHSPYTEPEETLTYFRGKLVRVAAKVKLDGLANRLVDRISLTQAHWIHDNTYRLPNFSVGTVAGITSESTGDSVTMETCMIPASPEYMVNHYPEERIIQIGRRFHGQRICLGMLTKRGGAMHIHEVLRAEGKIVDTGNDATAVSSVQKLFEVVDQVGLDILRERILIIGGRGATASLAAFLTVMRLREMSERPQKVLIVGREGTDLTSLVTSIGRNSVEQVASIAEGLALSRIVLTATGEPGGLPIAQSQVQKGTVIGDIARPRNIGEQFMGNPDVLVFEGGLYQYPGSDIQDTFNSGLPPGWHYACETQGVALTLENNPDLYTIGQEPNPERALTIADCLTRHGFQLAGLRSYGQSVTDKRLEDFRRVVSDTV